MSMVLLGSCTELCLGRQLRFHYRGMRRSKWSWCKRQDGQGKGTPGQVKDCAQHLRECTEVQLEEQREEQGSESCSFQKRKVAH